MVFFLTLVNIPTILSLCHDNQNNLQWIISYSLFQSFWTSKCTASWWHWKVCSNYYIRPVINWRAEKFEQPGSPNMVLFLFCFSSWGLCLYSDQGKFPVWSSLWWQSCVQILILSLTIRVFIKNLVGGERCNVPEEYFDSSSTSE